MPRLTSKQPRVATPKSLKIPSQTTKLGEPLATPSMLLLIQCKKEGTNQIPT